MLERALRPEDLPQILQLQKRIHAQMEHNEWLVNCEEEEIVFILAGGGYGMGLFEENRLMGAWLLYYPIGRADALGGEIGQDKEKVAHYELALLDKALRGRGLHKKMVEKLTKHCAQDGRFTHILATAHPDNQASLRGFTGCGYTIAVTKPLYGGVLRSIAVKKLKD